MNRKSPAESFPDSAAHLFLNWRGLVFSLRCAQNLISFVSENRGAEAKIKNTIKQNKTLTLLLPLRVQYLAPGRENRRTNFLSINQMLVKWMENVCSRDHWFCACKRMQVTTMGLMRIRVHIQSGESWEVLYPTPKKGLGYYQTNCFTILSFQIISKKGEVLFICPYRILFDNDGQIRQHDTLLLLLKPLDWRSIAHFVRWFVGGSKIENRETEQE